MWKRVAHESFMKWHFRQRAFNVFSFPRCLLKTTTNIFWISQWYNCKQTTCCGNSEAWLKPGSTVSIREAVSFVGVVLFWSRPPRHKVFRAKYWLLLCKSICWKGWTSTSTTPEPWSCVQRMMRLSQKIWEIIWNLYHQKNNYLGRFLFHFTLTAEGNEKWRQKKNLKTGKQIDFWIIDLLNISGTKLWSKI